MTYLLESFLVTSSGPLTSTKNKKGNKMYFSDANSFIMSTILLQSPKTNKSGKRRQDAVLAEGDEVPNK